MEMHYLLIIAYVLIGIFILLIISNPVFSFILWRRYRKAGGEINFRKYWCEICLNTPSKR